MVFTWIWLRNRPSGPANEGNPMGMSSKTAPQRPETVHPRLFWNQPPLVGHSSRCVRAMEEHSRRSGTQCTNLRS